jgi:hypothetical protein
MAEIPEKWLTLPRAMRVWHGIALTPPERRTSDFSHAAQVLDAQANEVALIVERLKVIEREAAAFIAQTEGIRWHISPPLGKGAGSIDLAYNQLKATVAGKQS